MPESQPKRYVVLPAYGFQSETLGRATILQTGPRTVRVQAHADRRDPGSTEIEILHSTRENGPKLVEMTPGAELNLRSEVSGLKIVPVVEYEKMRVLPQIERGTDSSHAATASASQSCQIKVTDRATGEPLSGATVIAFTNYRFRRGASGMTGKSGTAEVEIRPGARLDRLYIYGPARYWGHYGTGLTLASRTEYALQRIDLAGGSLLLTAMYAGLPANAGENVVVGIVDSGVAGDHPALPNVTGGANMVTDETIDDPGAVGDWGPAKTDGEHGTHVAGIVGMRPTAEAVLRGVAPGVSLRSYRVFPNSGGGATNYDIMSAIDRAVDDGCHVINLSLGGGAADEAVRAAIGSALDRGAVVVAAAGNDGRRPVRYPAAWPSCVAVSAMGRKGSFPRNSTEQAEIAAPYGAADSEAFVAAFSNMGPQIDHAGPGVAIVSTLPEGSYGTMNGTSMACPAVAGIAAYLLASNTHILEASGETRSRLLIDALNTSARPKGFGRDFEGFGIPGEGPAS